MTTPEDEAREIVDKLLEAAGWVVQDKDKVNLGASFGVALRYFQLKNQKEADSLLLKASGGFEAKPISVMLSI